MENFEKKGFCDKVRSNIFFKILRFIAKACVVFVLVIYTWIGASASLVIIEKEIISRKELSQFEADIKEAEAENDYKNVLNWIKYRPLDETDSLVNILTPYSVKMPATMFFSLAGRYLNLEKSEEAVFWLQLARFRLRYDSLRCGAAESNLTVDRLLSAIVSKKLQDLILVQKPEAALGVIQQVLDFDAKYPAENDPEYICKAIDIFEQDNLAKTQKSDWEKIHFQLRAAAKIYVQESKEASDKKAEKNK